MLRQIATIRNNNNSSSNNDFQQQQHSKTQTNRNQFENDIQMELKNKIHSQKLNN